MIASVPDPKPSRWGTSFWLRMPAAAGTADRAADRPLSPRVSLFLTILFAAAFATCIYGRWLGYDNVPVTPAQDLAKHVAMALNFAAAVADGQPWPRLQLNHPQVPDIPLFQYYGFMTGFAAFPFLKLGLSGIQAVVTSLIFLRFAGLLALYAAGRRLGLSQPAAWLAIALFALEPYLLSTLYGRVAVPEFHAQSELPFILWGYALLATGRGRTGFVVVTAVFVCLAFTHNIFFLYGAAFFILLVASSALPLRFRFFGALALGAAVMISAPQWLPALLSSSELNIDFFLKNPHYNGYLTDGSGLFGFYRPLGEHGDDVRYYFTYSWWTLPGLAALVLVSARRRQCYPISLVALLALLLSLGWFDIWSLLPRFTWALQFPYRLIPFVALAGALGSAALLDRFFRPPTLLLFGVIASFTVWPILSMPPFDRQLTISDKDLEREYASSDYVAVGQYGTNQASRIVASDLWLKDDNLLYGDKQGRITVLLRCRSIFPDHPVVLTLVSTDGKAQEVSNSVVVPPGAELRTFTLATNRVVRTARIRPSEYLVPAVVDRNPFGDRRRLFAYVESLIVNDRPIVGIAKARLVARSGLKRQFQTQPAGSIPAGTAHTPAPVGLPTAYTPLLRAWQNGRDLPVSAAADGTSIVRAVPGVPIETEYQLPLPAWILFFLGVALFAVGLRLTCSTRGGPLITTAGCPLGSS
ncbi:MAG: hypothetical protein HY302_07205 [Opitutae bacterium]|nr:hypothetical protein [Opitutae bacterium]